MPGDVVALESCGLNCLQRRKLKAYVHENVEMEALYEVTKTLNCNIYGKKFTVEGAVIFLYFVKFPWKECERLPVTFWDLLQNYSNCQMGCIHSEACGGSVAGMDE